MVYSKEIEIQLDRNSLVFASGSNSKEFKEGVWSGPSFSRPALYEYENSRLVVPNSILFIQGEWTFLEDWFGDVSPCWKEMLNITGLFYFTFFTIGTYRSISWFLSYQFNNMSSGILVGFKFGCKWLAWILDSQSSEKPMQIGLLKFMPWHPYPI